MLIKKVRLFGVTLACLLVIIVSHLSFTGEDRQSVTFISENSLDISESVIEISGMRNSSDLDSLAGHVNVQNEKNLAGVKSKTIEVKDVFALVESQCSGNKSMIVAELKYSSLKRNTQFNFFVSLHDPDVDTVVSKGIKQGLFGPKDKYPSVDEIHAICEHGNDPESGYRANCGHGGVFVEVGSAIGMVGIYAVSRGMKVYAFDPLKPNLDRLRESLCLNGQRECFTTNSMGASKCIGQPQPTLWRSYAPSNFIIHESLVGSESAGERQVASEPGNLAATLRGGGSFQTAVKTVTIDESVPDAVIDVLLLTCQGYESDVRPPPQPLPFSAHRV